jgi:dTDP-4-amino-4,6-dideoxygalactose transaminase
MLKVHSVPNLYADVAPLLRDIYERGVMYEGEYCRALERRLNEILGKPCVVTSTGMSALELMISYWLAKGVRDIVVPNLCFSPVAAFAYRVGMRVHIIDTAPDSPFLDVNEYRRVASSLSRQHLLLQTWWFGIYDRELNREVHEIAEQYGGAVVQDAAHLIGIRGVEGDCAYSLTSTKICGGAEGGAVASNNEELLEWVASAKRFSWDSRRQMKHIYGDNYKLSEIHAAMALSALKHLDRDISRRLFIAHRMEEGILKTAKRLVAGHHDYNGYVFPLLLPKERREWVESELARREIEVWRYLTCALSAEPMLERNFVLPNSHSFTRRLLCLGTNPEWRDEDVDYIVDCVNDALRRL